MDPFPSQHFPSARPPRYLVAFTSRYRDSATSALKVGYHSAIPDGVYSGQFGLPTWQKWSRNQWGHWCTLYPRPSSPSLLLLLTVYWAWQPDVWTLSKSLAFPPTTAPRVSYSQKCIQAAGLESSKVLRGKVSRICRVISDDAFVLSLSQFAKRGGSA